MWNFFEVIGRSIIVILIVVSVIGGLGTGIYYLDRSLKDYQAEVNFALYGEQMAGYMRVCTNLEVPAQVCVLAWPNGVRK